MRDNDDVDMIGSGIGAAIEYVYEKGQQTYRSPQVIEEGAVPFAMVPDGLNVREMEHLLPSPLRIKEREHFIDVPSFCRYVDLFHQDQTAIFARLSMNHIEAVIDYHGHEDPSWCDHRAVLTLQPSPDWEKWTKGAGKLMSQTEFAEFLEDLAHTVIKPDAAAVCDMALNLQANVDVRFESKINRFTGGSQLVFVETISDGAKGDIKLPDSLLICVPPYRASKPVDMLVRLRVRISEGKAKFLYVLDRPDRVIEQAFVDICMEIGATLPGYIPYRCP